MGATKKRTLQAVQAEEDEEDVLAKLGKQLLTTQKTSKDAVMKALRTASRILEDAPQSSDGLRAASANLCSALAKTDGFLKHKDKEVRLYATLCAIHTLRLHAPENPYSDPQLYGIFRQLLSVFRELADPGAAHFQVCLSLLDTVGTIKICLLMLDLEAADNLILDLFFTMFDIINADNKDLLEHHALKVLTTMIDDSDDIPQQLLDCVLGHLLPAAHTENPHAYHLAKHIILKSQPVLQPYIQKFMTRLLEGQRTDSELAGCSSDLVLEVYRAAPQIMLPVLPHLQPSLQVDSEERRLDAVDLICKILTHPGAHAILEDYRTLPQAVLRRLNDRSPEVRLRVLSHVKALADCCTDAAQRDEVVKEVTSRLQDPDERLRSAGAAALCSIAADHPGVLHTAQVQSLVLRLRDKRLPVRKEVAWQMAKLIKSWCLRWETEGGTSEARQGVLVMLAMGLCGMCLSRDTELAAYIMGDLFKGGMFPAKLPHASTTQWWTLLWQAQEGPSGPILAALLRAKCDIQFQVQELLKLREAALQEERGNTVGGPGRLSFGETGPGSSENATGTDGESASAQLASRLAALATGLPDVNRAEDGLQRLWGMKDNHIFRGLGVLAAYGTSFADAVAAGKDVQSRVGSRGPASEVTQALIARLTPTLLSPEVLPAALRACCDGADEQALVAGLLSAAPQMFAQQLPNLTELFELDDPMAAEVGAKVLAVAGSYISAAAQHAQQEVNPVVLSKLQDLCLTGTPSGAKAAVRALLQLLDVDAATPILREVCNKQLEALREPETLAVHSRILAGLKTLAAATRAVPALLEEFALDLYDCVMNHLMQTDLSNGRPLTPSTEKVTGREWGRPSPDVEIKTAALRTLAQALVPDDPTVRTADVVAEVVTAYIAELGDLTDIDARGSPFEGFKWHLDKFERPNSKRGAAQGAAAAAAAAADGSEPVGSGDSSLGRKRKASDAEMDSSDEEEKEEEKVEDVEDSADASEEEALSEEQLDFLIRDTENVSPDVGWVRYAAASALLRLFRGYDALMTGNDYLAIGLACQEPLAMVRLGLLNKLAATVAHFQTGKAANPQRAAKAAALYAIYSADPEKNHARAGFDKLKEYVAGRRAAVERTALAAAAAGDTGGTLINEMPEFILPFLVYFIAHHPDYNPEVIQQEDLFLDPLLDDDNEENDSPLERFIKFIRRVLQMPLELLLLPSKSATGNGAVDHASEVARQAGATFKILRQLKFCDVLEVTAVRGQGEVDPGATTYAHQVCDLALSIGRQLLRLAMGNKPLQVQKFPGAMALPRLCYRPRKDLGTGDKRKDGSDLPGSFRPTLAKLFTQKYAPGTPLGAPGKKPRGRSKPRGEIVEQRARGGAAGAAGDGDEFSPKPARPAARSKPAGPQRKRTKPAPERATRKDAVSPVRQQPRRGAKDAAGEKLRDAAEDSNPEKEDMEWESSGSEPASTEKRTTSNAVPAAPGSAQGLPRLTDLALGTSADTSGGGWNSQDSPGQENGNLGNWQQQQPNGAAKAAGLDLGKKPKKAAAGVKPKRARA